MSTHTARTSPPVAPRRPQARTHHGVTFDDPYEWLRDKSNPEVISLLEAENAHADAHTAHLADLRDEIFEDIKARTLETDLSVPQFTRHSGGDAWWYYSRTVEGSAYPLYCRAPARDRDQAPDPAGEIVGEQVYLDANREAEGHEFFSLGALTICPDGSQVAFSIDNSGDERFDLFVRHLGADGESAPHGDTIGPVASGIAHGATWAGQTHLFYTRPDEAWRPFQVWCHTLGVASSAGSSDDVLVAEETDERYWVGVDSSRDERWLVISKASKLTSECLLLPSDLPTATPVPVARRREGVEYNVEVGDGELFILHNSDSPDFSIARANLTWDENADELAPVDTWRDFVPAAEGVRHTSVEAYRDFVVVSRRKLGISGIEVHPLADGSAVVPLDFPEVVYDAQTGGSEDLDTDRFQLTYSSLATPTTVFDYHVGRGELIELKQTPVRDHPRHGAYNANDYVTERQWATAADGTKIPLSIVRHRDTPLDGSAPGLLYGYGSYEVSIPPRFVISRLSLLDRGFVFAIAHVRGGGEMGRAWYDNGKTLTKKNTFTDFVDSARWLIENRYTSADRLVAEGGSAGGLLMGAITNLAPELFCGVHAAVAFVDALTTILDPSLPLTVTEWEEWGDPLHDPEVYTYMAGYSPYENITANPLPNILATTGLNDTRVYYVEPTKWVQALRHPHPTSDDGTALDGGGVVLQKTEMVAGHAGVTGRYDQWRERAWELAWIIDTATRTQRSHRSQG